MPICSQISPSLSFCRSPLGPTIAESIDHPERVHSDSLPSRISSQDPMDPFEHSRNVSSAAVQSVSLSQLAPPAATPLRIQLPAADPRDSRQVDIAFAKGPKRKRLAKACDACHKSKRRCDGTAPCSNCYFASKTCTYTDASGRPVPAPRHFKLDRPDSQQDSRQPLQNTLQTPQVTDDYPAPQSALQPPLNREGDNEASRKRFRSEQGNRPAPMEPLLLIPETGSSLLGHGEHPAGLDNSLIRELVNLFFAHCNPTRMIIHKPSFSANLSHGVVPLYLLQAIYAVAAPWSKQPRIRTTPTCCAGKPFAKEALSKILDSSGRLLCEPNLATAQALCLLQFHDLMSKPTYSTRYRDLALHIVDKLGIHRPENPTPIPALPPQFIQAYIERECARRIFWLTHLMDVKSSIYFGTFLPPKENELLLRLPVDETSFELAVYSTLPEYLYLPAPRTPYASEFGHLIRVISIYSKVEKILEVSEETGPGNYTTGSLHDLEQLLDSWISSLPDHLRFSDENLQVQLSMYETSSNSSAWCFCCMHVLHASVALALNMTKQRDPGGPKSELEWATARLETIITSLGSRAGHDLIMGAALWSFIKYCQRDDPQIRNWSAEYQAVWGFNMQDVMSKDWRNQYSQVRQFQPRILEARPLVASPVPIIHSQHRNPDPLARSLSASPYPSIGKSFGELRLHGRSSHPESRPFVYAINPHDIDTRRLISDADIDPVLQLGSSERSYGIMDGPQSLPSLKASGLLDSWAAGKEDPMTSSWTVGTHFRVDHRHSPSRKSPLTPPESSRVTYDADSSRTATHGMPVGMPWLANEARL